MKLVTLTKKANAPNAVLSRAGQDLPHFPGKLRHSTAVHSTWAAQDQPFPSHHRRPWCFSPVGVKAPQPHSNEWLGPAGVAAPCLSFPSMASTSLGTSAVPGVHFPLRDTAGTPFSPSHECHPPMSSPPRGPQGPGLFQGCLQGQTGWMQSKTSSGLTGSSQLPSAGTVKWVCIS